MSRFDFKSPGAAMGDAVEMYFARRRQEMQEAAQLAEQRRQIDEQRARLQQQDKRQAEQDRQASEDRQRKMSREDAAASTAANTRGMNQMTADAVSQPGFDANRTLRQQLASNFIREGFPVPDYLKDAITPPAEPRRQVVETVDERGRPVRRSVSEDDLIAGVPTYQAPKEPREQSRRWVTRGGQPMFVSEGDIRPGDRPYENASGGDKPTQGQSAADAFYSRAKDASDVLVDVEDDISQFNRYVPNFLQSEDGQAYEQAKRQFIEAYLRKDSGAAIADSEYASADTTYFIQPGDSTATVKRKRAARKKILDSLEHQGTNSGGNTGGAPMRPMPSHGNTGAFNRDDARKRYGY